MSVSMPTRELQSRWPHGFRSDDRLGYFRIDENDMTPQLLAQRSEGYPGDHRNHCPLGTKRHDACHHASPTAFLASIIGTFRLCLVSSRHQRIIAERIVIVRHRMTIV